MGIIAPTAAAEVSEIRLRNQASTALTKKTKSRSKNIGQVILNKLRSATDVIFFDNGFSLALQRMVFIQNFVLL